MNLNGALSHGYSWTAKRIGAVQETDLERQTPCTDWNVVQLLDHTFVSGRLLSAMASAKLAPADAADFGAKLLATCQRVGDPVGMYEKVVAAPSLAVWEGPLDHEVTVSFGTAPASFIARLNLLEVVIHGWDISQSTGEAAEIPAELAEPILACALEVLQDPRLTSAFAPAHPVPDGASAAESVIALLGRKPLTH